MIVNRVLVPDWFLAEGRADFTAILLIYKFVGNFMLLVLLLSAPSAAHHQSPVQSASSQTHRQTDRQRE